MGLCERIYSSFGENVRLKNNSLQSELLQKIHSLMNYLPDSDLLCKIRFGGALNDRISLCSYYRRY